MKKLFILFILMNNYLLFSQGPTLIEPFKEDLSSVGLNYNLAPPEVTNFNKINFTEINLSVGKPLISIPLFTIKEGNIEYPITLSYDAGGIKVSQTASSVGLGWNITNTVISRNVIGGNDFNNYGHRKTGNHDTDRQEIIDYELGYSKVGYFSKNENDLNLNDSYSEGQGVGDAIYNLDYFPDIYNLNSPLLNSSFYFKNLNTAIELHSNGNKITAQKLKYTNYNLALQLRNPNSPFYDFNNFKIISNKGIEFSFNEFSVSQNITYNDWFPVYFVPANQRILPEISSWYVSEIKDLASSHKLSFRYTTFFTDTMNGAPSFSESELKSMEADIITNFSFANTSLFQKYANECVYKPLYSKTPHFTSNGSYNRSFSEKVIREISFSSGTVNFLYSQKREDAYNKHALTDIIVKNFNGEIIKHFKFSYGYFNAEDCYNNPFNCKRLKLNSITENDIRTYKFTYNESINLPGRNSSSIDFLGYYNKSKTFKDLNPAGSRPVPYLYFYPDQSVFSLLPFKFENKTHFPLAGDFDRTSNKYTFANILTHIAYPEGGKETFEYELNEFNIFGNIVQGGGARIKKQILLEKNNITQQKSYEYNNSGYINNFPSFGFPRVKLHDVSFNYDDRDPNYGEFTSYFNGYPNWETDEYIYTFNIVDKNNINADLLTGSYVSYDKVKENLLGNGYNLYEFTSSKNYPNQIKFNENGDRFVRYLNGTKYNNCFKNFFAINGGLGNSIFTDNSFLRGKLTKLSVFDENNFLIKNTENKYKIYTNSINKYIAPIYNHYETKGGDIPYIEVVGGIEKDYSSNFFALEKTTIQTHTKNNNSITLEEYFTYNKRSLLKSRKSIDSKGDTIISVIKYPDDIVQNDIHNTRELLSRNILHLPISKTAMYQSQNKVLDQVDYIFNDENGAVYLANVYNSRATSSSLNISPDNLIVSYDEYDSFGNLLQYTEKDGTPVSIIWGYNEQYPVAKIEGVALSQISNATILTLNTKTTDSELLTAIAALRTAHKDAMVTGYLYKPLVGVTQIIQPNGMTEKYHYDAANRLKSIVNDQNEVIKTFEYNYKQP
ncbi:hypothetical protein HX001_07910 [Empedobacter brevis]|uniref:RHS repeat protein n=1 Tax=Empedobacter brevis TaxID=247 RepID=A0AAJ1V7T2_9FLAO|nr:hypothetical protein [Empedobacter brevis]MDM1072412.1 hypothetical protein [Empedobacter brevis]